MELLFAEAKESMVVGMMESRVKATMELKFVEAKESKVVGIMESMVKVMMGSMVVGKKGSMVEGMNSSVGMMGSTVMKMMNFKWLSLINLASKQRQ